MAEKSKKNQEETITEDKAVVTIAQRIAASTVDKTPGKEASVMQFENVNPKVTGNIVSGDVKFAFQNEQYMITGIVNRYSKKAKLTVIPL